MPAPLLLVGLGNPGPAYEHTRHNVGFDCLDFLARALTIRWRSLWFRPVDLARSSELVCAKPRTYMNRSGQVVPYLLRRHRIPPHHFCVILDNMDLPLGEVRMKRRGGPAGHNGLKSISRAYGSDDYPRLYIGIGPPRGQQSRVEHVLGRFSDEERPLVDRALERLVPILQEATDLELPRMITLVNEQRYGTENGTGR